MIGCAALVVAAGRGSRAGGGLPKQYRTLGGDTLVGRVVARFAAHPAVDAVRVVIDPDHRQYYDAAVAGHDLLDPVEGGGERQDSVRLGLESLVVLAPKRVLIHDAARPLVSAGVIDRVLAGIDGALGAIPALPVTDSLKRGHDGGIVGSVDRAGLWRAQTPQGFAFPAILAAHAEAAGQTLTDDAAVAEAVGFGVALVPGDEDNIKVTDEADLARAEAILAARAPEVRTGIGFDVHRLGPGGGMTLCGVAIAGEHGLVGHSDGDVAIHAVVDALLGAIGGGDIGAHFPADDGRWRDADSALFLSHAAGLVGDAGGAVSHIDLTIICERPRIAPHRATMIARLAAILGLDPGRVNVKATTTEGLGLTGRGEGIAAQAVATVLLAPDRHHVRTRPA